MCITNRRYSARSHRRRSIRLSALDYSQPGAYFVTVVTQARECLFGEVSDSEMRLNRAGVMVRDIWIRLPCSFSNVSADNFVVMPNHIHAIVEINDVGAPLVGAPAPAGRPAVMINQKPFSLLGAVIGAFKSLTTVEYSRGVRKEGWAAFQGRLWQRNYFEHIVRSDEGPVTASSTILSTTRATGRTITRTPRAWPEDRNINNRHTSTAFSATYTGFRAVTLKLAVLA